MQDFQADCDIGTSSKDEKDNDVEVNVHMYASAVLKIPVGEHIVELEQKTNWPWDGNIRFELKNPQEISTTIRIRIPAWAEDWTVRTLLIAKTRTNHFQITPELRGGNKELTKGYLTLLPDYLNQNHSFQLNIPLKPRYITPHPYTNQNIIALARGPIVYCVEDYDNPWVNDHFKVHPSLPTKPTPFRAHKCLESCHYYHWSNRRNGCGY